ncbi:hypothetical protein B0H14DRAFT_3882640 [Mycena olivaceomarginata]|nr:hypothetical protein B0H14DRAFT_3882640 [Mycena olivaceomarginata]
MLQNIDESLSTAEDLRTWCSTTPNLNAYRPITASAVEVRHAGANLVGNQRAEKLAVNAVREGNYLDGTFACPPKSFNSWCFSRPTWMKFEDSWSRSRRSRGIRPSCSGTYIPPRSPPAEYGAEEDI